MYRDDLKKELEKEVELNLEKEKLEEVLKEIEVQVLECIETRKKVIDYILKLRKKNLEQYEDDEDKVVEYFNHEMYEKEEQYRLVNKSIKELTILSNSPYFGKVRFQDEYGEEEIHIGRFGVTGRKSYEPIVTDWRSPVSALFYAGKLGTVKYTSPMGEVETEVLSKRQFIIKKSNLVGMFDSSIDVKDEILQMVLSKNAGEKLKDIVMTIQKEQDNLIRQPRTGAIVVNGVAGSGKTTIALHRVAYLLYNYRKVLQGKVLILGPNSIFIDYISLVLPSLGEEKVTQITFREFAENMLNVPHIMDFKDYMEKALSGQKDFSEEIRYKGSLQYVQDMDNLIGRLEKDCFKIEDVFFYDKLIISGEDIDKMFNYYFKDMPLFKRSARIKRVIYSKVRDERNRLIISIQKEYENKVKSLTESELNDCGNELEYKRRNDIRDVIKEVINIKKNKLIWLKNPDVITLYNDFNGNKLLIYDDLAPILYLKIKLEGLRYRNEIRHIVIDEAQDYSLLQFRVIYELTKCKSFTIVGDTNQKIIFSKETPAVEKLENILPDLEIKRFSLNKSYRSTNEIIDYANKYLEGDKTVPLVRSGKKVVEKRVDNSEELVDKILDNVVKLKERGYESIAIICRDLKDTEAIGNLIKTRIHINVLDREDMIYSSGEVILPSYFAKGLEFDAVIMIDTCEKNENTLKYIMATRALHELYVYKTSSIN